MATLVRRSLRVSRSLGTASFARFSPATHEGRLFSTTSSRDTNYGFIGLGAMGYPMAVNLRAKIDPKDHMVVHDVNAQSAEKFKSENSSGVTVAKTSSEAAKDSVSTSYCQVNTPYCFMMIMFSQYSDLSSCFGMYLDVTYT